MTRTPHIVASLCVLAGGLAFSTATALAAEPEAPCSNEQLRAEQPFASALPDCRAYEMVSPLVKGDDGVSALGSRAAVGGEAIVYSSLGSFAEPRSATLQDAYIARR